MIPETQKYCSANLTLVLARAGPLRAIKSVRLVPLLGWGNHHLSPFLRSDYRSPRLTRYPILQGCGCRVGPGCRRAKRRAGFQQAQQIIF